MEELLQFVQKRGAGIGGITTALPYLLTIDAAASGARAGVLGPRDLSLYTGASWQKCLKDAANKFVYRNDAMRWLNKSTDNAPDGARAVAVFDAVITSIQEDRDGDILHPKGMNVDPVMPLLWQHNPNEPIGKLCKLLGTTDKDVRGQFAIADIPLGRDAAYLAEFGALRISHGFKPKKFKPRKSGNDIVGFEVEEADVMEASLVSVPSNTSAVITAFSRNKLESPLAKSWGRTLYKARPIVVRGGWGGFQKAVKRIGAVKSLPKTGRVAKVKADDAFEEALAAAASTVVHGNDYGYCFYQQPDGEKQEYQVFWTMGDADIDGQTADGTPYSTPEDIRAILGNVPGVVGVALESEATPPKGEGWRMVYPDARDWNDDAANDGQGAGNTNGANDDEPPASASAKARKNTGTVDGSFEHVAATLAPLAAQYLNANSVTVDEEAVVFIVATFADSVVVCVCSKDEPETHYQIAYTRQNDVPAFTGTPVLVELSVVLGTEVKPDANNNATAQEPDAADGTTEPTKRTRWAWKTVGRSKGKLTRKDTGALNEALEHFNEALGANKMPTTIKTLVQRGTDLVDGVVKGTDTSDSGDNGTNGDMSADIGKALSKQLGVAATNAWRAVAKAAADPNAAPYTLALLFQNLSAAIVADAHNDEQATLGQALTV